MQLSLSAFPSAPKSPAPGAGDVESVANAAEATAPSAAPGKDASFASLLPKPSEATKPAAGKAGDDAEQAAAILAATLWMPVTPVPPVTVGPTGNAGSGTTETIEAASASTGIPVLGASSSSRAFGSLVGSLPGQPFPGQTKGQEVGVPSVTADPAATTKEKNPEVEPATAAAPVIEAVNDSFGFSPPVMGQVGPVPPAKSLPAKVTTDGKSTALPVTEPGKPAPAGIAAAVKPVAPDVQLLGGEVAVKDASLPATNPEKAPVTFSGGEKNAAPLPALMNNSSAQDFSGKKDFLNTGQAGVTVPSSAVGIAVAQGSAVMPAVSPNRSKPASNSVAGQVLNIVTNAAREFTAVAPAIASAVHDTMAAVVSAVDTLERQAVNGPKSVDLQLPVGDQQLGVRVELKDGTVHTTFRTDSAELRTALTHEWQSVVQPGSTRDVRLADPVFNSSSAGSDNASGSLGQGSPHSREQKAPAAAAFALRSEPADSAAPEPVRSAAHSVTTQLLHAFA